MGNYRTDFGSIHQFKKGGVTVIDDQAKKYIFSNMFEVASKAKPYERTAVAKNFEYVIESVRAEGGRRRELHHELSMAGGGFAGKLSSRPRQPWRRWRRMRRRRKAACGGEGRPGPATVAAHARRAQHAQRHRGEFGHGSECSSCLCVRGCFGRGKIEVGFDGRWLKR